jgi:hypothetical protein
VGKGYEEDIRQMMQWISVAPDEKVCYGTMNFRDDKSWEDLGVRASTCGVDGAGFVDWALTCNHSGTIACFVTEFERVVLGIHCKIKVAGFPILIAVAPEPEHHLGLYPV